MPSPPSLQMPPHRRRSAEPGASRPRRRPRGGGPPAAPPPPPPPRPPAARPRPPRRPLCARRPRPPAAPSRPAPPAAQAPALSAAAQCHVLPGAQVESTAAFCMRMRHLLHRACAWSVDDQHAAPFTACSVTEAARRCCQGAPRACPEGARELTSCCCSADAAACCAACAAACRAAASSSALHERAGSQHNHASCSPRRQSAALKACPPLVTGQSMLRISETLSIAPCTNGSRAPCKGPAAHAQAHDGRARACPRMAPRPGTLA